jgi:hypothetical protein
LKRWRKPAEGRKQQIKKCWQNIFFGGKKKDKKIRK